MWSEHYTGCLPPEMPLGEIDDLLDTIQRLASIGRLLVEQDNEYLLPTALEGLYEKAQSLVEYCIKDE